MPWRAVALATLTAALALAPSARAEVTGPDETVALVERSRVPVVNDQVVVVGPCPDEATAATAGGCTYMTPDAPIYMLPDFTANWAMVYHEFGHRFDFVAMTGRAHVQFAFMVGKTSRAGAAWGSWLQERFADAYAYCARNPVRLVDDDMITHYRLSNRSHRRICRLIEDVGVSAGLA